MTPTTNKVGFFFLKFLMMALFSPAHTEPMKTRATTAPPRNMPYGFRNLNSEKWKRHIKQETEFKTAQSAGRFLCTSVCRYHMENGRINGVITYIKTPKYERSPLWGQPLKLALLKRQFP